MKRFAFALLVFLDSAGIAVADEVDETIAAATAAVAGDEKTVQVWTDPAEACAALADSQVGGWALDPLGDGAITRSLPEFVAKSLPLMFALMAFMRGLSEALVIIAKRFSRNDLSTAATVVSGLVSVMARIAALFGIGAPKAVVMQRAEEIALKEAASVGRNTDGSRSDAPRTPR